jgi:orotate phosphoribosyltransferase
MRVTVVSTVCQEVAQLVAETPGMFEFGPTEIDGARVPFGPLELENLATAKSSRNRLTALCLDALKDVALTFNVVAGCESAGIPIALPVADALGVDYVSIRKAGFRRHSATEPDIAGVWRPPSGGGSRVLVIDDGIWSGASIEHAESVINSRGGILVGSLVLVDFSMLIRCKPTEELPVRRDLQSRVFAMTSFVDVVVAAAKVGVFSTMACKLVLEWVREDWAATDMKWKTLEIEFRRRTDADS